MLISKFGMRKIKKEKLSRLSYNLVDILPLLVIISKSRKEASDPDSLHKELKLFIKDFFSKCDQIRRFPRI